MSAPVRIEAEAWTDLRFATLARILGLADADHALIRTARIWSWQAEHYTPEGPTYVVDLDTIESALGTGGGGALVRARLAEEAPGGYRMRGAAGRIEWLWQKRQAARAGGEATKRKHGNKQGPHGQPHGEPAAELMPSPLVSAPVPDHPEDQNSLAAHTIPGDGGQPGSGEPGPRAMQQGAATPGQGATAQGAVSAAGNVAEPQFDPTGHRVERPPSPGPSAPAIAGPYNPDDPRAIGRLAESTWRRVSDAAIALAAELKLPEPIPFPAITPSTHRAGFVELKSRIREEGELAPTVCDRVVENLVKQARSKRSVDWLAEKVFGDKAWVNARNGIDPSARPPVPRRGDPLPPAPPPPRPERPPPDPVLSAEDRAEILALAARVGANPDAVAAAELASGRVPAHMPTAELVKRFGDGQRAPPDTPDPIADEPRKPPPRRKAAT